MEPIEVAAEDAVELVKVELGRRFESAPPNTYERESGPQVKNKTTTMTRSGLQIVDLKPDSRNVGLRAKIVRKGEPYEIQTRYNMAAVCDAVIEDETGTVGWRLWREQIGMVKAGDVVQIENAFVRVFQGRKEINLGRDGKITVLR